MNIGEKIAVLLMMVLLAIFLVPLLLSTFTGIGAWVGTFVLILFVIIAPILIIFKKGD